MGEGKTINIMNQPWLLDESNPYVTTLSPAIEDKRVSSLFYIDRKEWDIDVIRDVFNERDQRSILNIQLGDSNGEDMRYWKWENTGMYTVKSAYKRLQVQNGRWQVDNQSTIWRALWRVKAPPKALNLVWRALSNCLPTLTSLYSKHVPVQVWCPVCQEQVETVMHSLVSCSMAKQCWLILNLQIPSNQHTDFRVWMEEVLHTGSEKHRAEAVTLCWAIWRARNDLVWNQKTSSVNRIVATAKQNLTQWKLAQNRSYSTPLQPHHKGDGALIEAKAVVHAELTDPVLAEAMGVKEALSWIEQMKWPTVTLESNCLGVVQAIRSNAPMRSRYGVTILECRNIMRRLNNVELLFVKRSANMVAHQIARESYLLSGRILNRWSVPLSVKDCIEKDLLS